MTRDDLLEIIRSNISHKTEENSITPEIHGGVLEKVVEYISTLRTDDIKTLFDEVPDDNILPELQDGEQKLYFITASGEYHTEDGSEKIVVEQGERAIIQHNGTQWEKISIETLAQDITNSSKERSASQYIVKWVYEELQRLIREIEVPLSVEDGAQKNVQSDWNETDATKDTFIKNKPDIPDISGKAENLQTIRQPTETTDYLTEQGETGITKTVSTWLQEIANRINGIISALNQKEDTKDTAGNQINDNKVYLVGSESTSDTDGSHAKTYTYPDIYMKKGIMYGEVNNYRYMKQGMWNTLGGNLITNLYGNVIYNTILSAKDTAALEPITRSASAGYPNRYLRLGRIYSETAKRGYNATFILHVHSQAIRGDKHYGNGFTVMINKANGSNDIKVVKWFTNNAAAVDLAEAKFLNLIFKQTSFEDDDNNQHTDIIVEFQPGQINTAICASALMLSDSADLYQGEDYNGCFDFTYNINLQKEYIKAHPECQIPIAGRPNMPYNKSCLYISQKKPTIDSSTDTIVSLIDE